MYLPPYMVRILCRPLLQAINVLREMYQNNARKLPDNPPTQFIKPRWHKLIYTGSAQNSDHIGR